MSFKKKPVLKKDAMQVIEAFDSQIIFI